jgi:hypothetical protein
MNVLLHEIPDRTAGLPMVTGRAQSMLPIPARLQMIFIPCPFKFSTARRLLVVLVLAMALGGCETKHAERCKLECQARGLCTDHGGTCVASDAGDCRRSRACEEQGRCELVGDDCRATSTSCLTFPGCGARGACGERGGACAPTSNAHCAPTEGCRTDGLCTAQGGLCIAQHDDCRAAEACTRYSRCTAEEGRCGTYGPADCLPGELCKKQGYCTFVKDRCELTSRADCEKTEGCRELGVCTFVADTGKSSLRATPGCVLGSDADCLQSTACKERHACRKGTAKIGYPATCTR